MAFICFSKVTQTGDAGGSGVSRFAWRTGGSGAPLPADASAAAFALNNLYNAMKSHFPSTVTHTFDPLVEYVDEVSALVSGTVVASSVPQPITGAGGQSGYPAGVGLRINWRTAFIHNRRFMRGCTFLVPLDGTSYGQGGNILGSVQSAAVTAATSYLTGMQGVLLTPVIYHRPLKGQVTGGVSASIQNATVEVAPSVLRSRRV